MRELLDTADHWIDLEVDGGISAETISGAAAAGANALISGSAMFKHPGGLGARPLPSCGNSRTAAWETRD